MEWIDMAQQVSTEISARLPLGGVYLDNCTVHALVRHVHVSNMAYEDVAASRPRRHVHVHAILENYQGKMQLAI